MMYLCCCTANGAIGLYCRGQRQWRVKSRHFPTAICAYDITGDGEEEIIVGWSNGLMEARCQRMGQVVFQDQQKTSVAALLKVSSFGIELGLHYTWQH